MSDPTGPRTVAHGTADQRRGRRLREELVDAAIWLPDDDELAEALVDELDYARYPPIHEGELPSYGALLFGAGPFPDTVEAVLARAVPGDAAMLRRLADGRHTFVARCAEDLGLLLLDTAHDREADLVDLRETTGAVIVQRVRDGLIRVLSPPGMAIWDGSHWWTKPYAAGFVDAIGASIPDAARETLRGLLGFCVHTMSPARCGATLIWFSSGDPAMIPGLNPRHPPHSIPGLALGDIARRSAARQLLGQVDGAAIVDSGGRLVAVGAHLRSSPRSHEEVPHDQVLGTRHGSARRYTFDQPDAVALVVSRDGPVTVYSSGEEVAVIGDRWLGRPERL